MKALESLTLLKDFALGGFDSNLDKTFIEGACDIIEKELKAFAIIKDKRVNVYWLLVCFREGGLKRYNDYLDMLYLPECNLTQEEYDLLEEALS